MTQTRERAVGPRRARIGWVAATLALAAGGAAAATGPLFGTECGFNASVLADGAAGQGVNNLFCSGGVLEARGETVKQAWTGEEQVVQVFSQHALSTASASAGLGSVGAHAHALATSSPMQKLFLYSDGSPGVLENDSRAIAQAGIWASWWDTITVQPGASYGRVLLRYTLKLDGTAALNLGRGDASLYARLFADDDRGADDPSVMLQQAGTVSFQKLYWPGTQIRVSGDIGVSARAEAGRIYLDNGWVRDGYVAESEATADAAHTAAFQIEVLDTETVRGASYTSASGRSYVTMVPEPATWALWLLGGALLLPRARRRLAAVPATPAGGAPRRAG